MSEPREPQQEQDEREHERERDDGGRATATEHPVMSVPPTAATVVNMQRERRVIE